jgi:hypothetical protein
VSLVAISPRRAKLGGFPRGMRSADIPPPTPAAGSPPAGPWQEPNWVYQGIHMLTMWDLDPTWLTTTSQVTAYILVL